MHSPVAFGPLVRGRLLQHKCAIYKPPEPPIIIIKTFITSASSIYIGSITVRLCARIAMILPEHQVLRLPSPALDLSVEISGVVDCGIDFLIIVRVGSMAV